MEKLALGLNRKLSWVNRAGPHDVCKNDLLGRRTKRTLAGNQSETFGYDAVGNLIRHTNFNRVVLTNQYDALNRLTNAVDARLSGMQNTRYEFDAAGNLRGYAYPHYAHALALSAVEFSTTNHQNRRMKIPLSRLAPPLDQYLN